MDVAAPQALFPAEVAAPAYMDVDDLNDSDEDDLYDSDEEKRISDTSGLKFLHVWWPHGALSMAVHVGSENAFKKAIHSPTTSIRMSCQYDKVSKKEIENILIHELNQNVCGHSLSLHVRSFLFVYFNFTFLRVVQRNGGAARDIWLYHTRKFLYSFHAPRFFKNFSKQDFLVYGFSSQYTLTLNVIICVLQIRQPRRIQIC